MPIYMGVHVLLVTELWSLGLYHNQVRVYCYEFEIDTG